MALNKNSTKSGRREFVFLLLVRSSLRDKKLTFHFSARLIRAFAIYKDRVLDGNQAIEGKQGEKFKAEQIIMSLSYMHA